MINNQAEYEAAMLKLANMSPTCVDTPEEDMVNELIDEIKEYEREKLGIVDEEIPFGEEYTG